MTPLKIVVTGKINLQTKYGNKFSIVDKLLNKLATSDKKKNIETIIIYIDDKASAAKAKIKAVKAVTPESCKNAIDEIFKKLNPAYLVIFGAQDIIPFQEIKNPCEDFDTIVPSDLPYACETPFSNNIADFTGPARVVGRIPDIPGSADINYLKTIFDTIINYRSVKPEKLLNYFSVTADVWKKSTEQTVFNIFGNHARLIKCPSKIVSYSKKDLKPLTHFYNCHGSPDDHKYYGQKGTKYPIAQNASDLDGKISAGTIVAAECCYGAQLFDPKKSDDKKMSIANTYFKNKAVAFAGSSTIAYGPSAGQGVADLITQYFIKNVIAGASTGRALLEARQKFLSVSGPHLDPYELKTIAQFYLLGDPAMQVVIEKIPVARGESIINRRLNLQNKGLNLAATVATAQKKMKPEKLKGSVTNEIKSIFSETGFSGNENQHRYELKAPVHEFSALTQSAANTQKGITYRALIRSSEKTLHGKFNPIEVLVLKEKDDELLGWKVYHRK